MKAFRGGAAVAIVAATWIAVACSIDVSLANKACPCTSGWVCDTARNVCVLPGSVGVSDGGAADAVAEAAPACPDDQCPCNVDSDCKDPTRSHCSPSKICVECVRSPDTCPALQFCNDAFQCTLGCKEESDCRVSPAVPHCNTTSHQCVQCITNDQCGDAGLLCSPSGSCVQGCDPSKGRGCPTDRTCCANLCLDITTDVLNCGACGTACSAANGTPRCVGSACAWTCASGYDHCAQGNTGCETNLRTDVDHCGTCTTDCKVRTANATGITCNAGRCDFTACTNGYGNCDGYDPNGCECACGAVAGQICCPGNVCTFDGGKCVGGGAGSGYKCQ